MKMYTRWTAICITILAKGCRKLGFYRVAEMYESHEFARIVLGFVEKHGQLGVWWHYLRHSAEWCKFTDQLLQFGVDWAKQEAMVVETYHPPFSRGGGNLYIN